MSILSSIIGEVGEAAQLGLRGGGESVLDARSNILKNIAESRAAREAHSQAMARVGDKYALKGDITLGGMRVTMPGNATMPKEHFKGLDGTLRGLSRDYPSVAEGIDKVALGGFRGDQFLKEDYLGAAELMGPAITGTGRRQTGIALAYDKIVKNNTMIVSNGGIGTLDNPMAATLNHEFGHHVHDLLSPAWASPTKDMSDGLALSMFDSFGLAKPLHPKIIDESLDSLGNIIHSPYGKTNVKEAFAESFMRLRQNIDSPGLNKFSDMIDAGLSGEVRYDNDTFQRLARAAESGDRYKPVDPLPMSERDRLVRRPKLQQVRPVFDRSAPSPSLRDHAIREIDAYHTAAAADDQFL